MPASSYKVSNAKDRAAQSRINHALVLRPEIHSLHSIGTSKSQAQKNVKVPRGSLLRSSILKFSRTQPRAYESDAKEPSQHAETISNLRFAFQIFLSTLLRQNIDFIDVNSSKHPITPGLIEPDSRIRMAFFLQVSDERSNIDPLIKVPRWNNDLLCRAASTFEDSIRGSGLVNTYVEGPRWNQLCIRGNS